MINKNIIQNINVPFDEIFIPSKGIFYPNKQSSFLVKYLTAKEENVLTSPSLVDSGKAMEIVLSSCIIDWDGDINDILVGDKNAVLIYLRSTSFGDKIKFKYTCPGCKVDTDAEMILSALEMKETEEEPDKDGCFTFTLPKMKIKLSSEGDSEVVNIKFKPITLRDEKEINDIIKNEKKIIEGNYIDNAIEARYRTQIVSINNIEDKEFIKKIIKRIPILDSTELRKFMEKVEPGIDNLIVNSCNNCHHICENRIPINSDFFGLDGKYKQNMMDEIFLISYYSKGGHTRDDLYSMPIYERRWVMERISEEVDKKNKAEQAAANKAKSGSKK